MSAWTNKRCQRCDKKKGQKQRHNKYCFSCRRAVDKERSRTQHAGAIYKKFGITLEQYEALYEFQGGVCYLCRFAKGNKKRLTVDHDHKCCPDLPACGNCVRGLLCVGCNRHVLAWAARDTVEFFERGIEYLTDPPFSRMIREKSSSSTNPGAQDGRQRGCAAGERGNVSS